MAIDWLSETETLKNISSVHAARTRQCECGSKFALKSLMKKKEKKKDDVLFLNVNIGKSPCHDAFMKEFMNALSRRTKN